jgi:hypothetical protein
MTMRKKHYITGVVIVLLVAGNIFFFVKYRQAVDNNPDVQTQRIIDDLRKTTTLPDETPSIVTVVDKTKLSNPTVAQGVENGDKIMLFQKAEKVVIYRPSTGQLVNILNLVSSDQATTPADKQSD